MHFFRLFIFGVLFSIIGCGEKSLDTAGSDTTELYQWQSLGQPEENRAEAIRRIIECDNCFKLDLSHLGLRELPPSLGLFQQFNQSMILNLAHNKLHDLPGFINRLSSLRLIILSNNEFNELPDAINQLPDCFVDIRNNPLSAEAKEAILFLYSLRQFNKPKRLIFDYNHEILQLISERILLAIAIQPWLPPSDKVRARFDNWEAGVNISDAQNLRYFLSKLWETADAQNQIGLERLKQRVQHVLVELQQRQDLRPFCFDLVKDALGACGNRVDIGLNNIEHTILNAKAESGEIEPEILEKMVIQQFRLRELAPIVCEKVKHVSPTIQVEVYLLYQLKLREQWDLLIQGQDMLYSSLVDLTEKELDLVKKKLKAAEQEEKLFTFFFEHEAWQHYLERKYADKFNTLKNQRDAEFNILENRYEELSEEYQEQIEVINKNAENRLYILRQEINQLEWAELKIRHIIQ
ncbi:NEL-type E3 ubiquitin ligase domain-containing protein [Mycoavidus sp. SF9855]|uniref:NEL-type E3 ubiquitin ligase domain-containing protein n=1 Tax=Mycoavidus sp. SF9855 TaxID=2968475 RepID=UPI00211BC224|nr:NEL-type E3 ubiquitin ligase domain-containing protein [Mycoavidus sp. SF9855]UUM22195.1 hypothetical protein NQD60_03700 [Mycoavidus sp. SF9855]